MNQKTVILVAIALLALVGSAYFFTRSTTPSKEEAIQQVLNSGGNEGTAAPKTELGERQAVDQPSDASANTAAVEEQPQGEESSDEAAASDQPKKAKQKKGKKSSASPTEDQDGSTDDSDSGNAAAPPMKKST